MNKIVLMISILAGVVLVIFGIVGIINRNDATPIRSKLDDVTLAKAGDAVCSDEEFLKHATKSAGFVSKTIEDGHEYSILFILETSDGGSIFIDQDHIAWDNAKGWRDTCKEKVFTDIITDRRVRELYDSGDGVESISTTISYDWGYRIASVCDSDNDGIVDDKYVLYL